jgi:hypothetical protein
MRLSEILRCHDGVPALQLRVLSDALDKTRCKLKAAEQYPDPWPQHRKNNCHACQTHRQGFV